MTTITSPLELWRRLCSSAGLELRLKRGRPGRDADVEVSLRLALGVPATARSLEAWLARDAASAQAKVRMMSAEEKGRYVAERQFQSSLGLEKD